MLDSSFLLQLCHDVRSLPIMAKNPVLQDTVTVNDIANPPCVLRFNIDTSKQLVEDISMEWLTEAESVF